MSKAMAQDRFIPVYSTTSPQDSALFDMVWFVAQNTLPEIRFGDAP
jgi:hypothetical protein